MDFFLASLPLGLDTTARIMFPFYILFFVAIVLELMARLANITGMQTVSRSVTTGKKWSSGANMAAEVSENRVKYMGGKFCKQ